MAGRVMTMDELRQQQLKRRIRAALADVDSMKSQLADVRRCCEELAAAMRKIRLDAEQAKAVAREKHEREQRRQTLRRVI